jgi:hypothetical protein
MEHCELVVNGSYQGVYLFGEKIKKKAGRLDLATLKITDNSGIELTGGYIWKIDDGTALWTSAFAPPYATTQQIKFVIDYPDAGDITPAQTSYIKAYVDSFETAMNASNFQDTALGWRRYGAVNAFVDYMIMNEIFMVDIYNDLGMNYSPDQQSKKNIFDVYVNIYFPLITYDRFENIIYLLNTKKSDKEIFLIKNNYNIIRNDIKLEKEVYMTVEEAKENFNNDKYFNPNYIIQSNIHVNINDIKNITGTTSSTKFNLYRIFDNFIVGNEYPFIQYLLSNNMFNNLTLPGLPRFSSFSKNNLIKSLFWVASKPNCLFTIMVANAFPFCGIYKPDS